MTTCLTSIRLSPDCRRRRYLLCRHGANPMTAARGPLIDLVQAVPGYPPHPDMLQWLGEAAASPAYTNYGPIEGETGFARGLCGACVELYGAKIGGRQYPHHIRLQSGVHLRGDGVAAAGDTVLMSDPFYFNQETTLSMLGINIELGALRCRRRLPARRSKRSSAR